MNPYLAISINGGGALGIGPLALMCRIEQDTGKRIGELAVAFAGTSTGSIIAAGLNEGYSAHDLYKLYYDNLGKIFTKYSWYKRLQPTCPTYDNSYLIKEETDLYSGYLYEREEP